MKTYRFPRVRATLAVACALACGLPSAQADPANYTTIVQNNAAVVAATQAFMATLTAGQLGTLQSTCTMTTGNGTLSYSYLVGLVTCWSNLPGSRNGLKLSNLTTAQYTAALAVVEAAMSSRGASYVSEIRAADALLNTKAGAAYGSGNYFIAIYGTPSATGSWQLGFGGHHLAVNISYNGAAVSGTPLFDGVEPPVWTDSANVTHSPLESQRLAVQNLAQLIQSDSVTAASAKLSGTFTDVVVGINASTGCDSNFPATYPTGSTGRGAAYNNLSTAQKTLVRNAIQAWTTLMPKVMSNTLVASYTSDTALSETYVGYSAGTGGTADFAYNPTTLTSQRSYLRIDGPRVWIEFVVQAGVVYSTQVHYHTIWRDKTADYGGNFTTGPTGVTGQCGASTSGGGGGGTPPTMPVGT